MRRLSLILLVLIGIGLIPIPVRAQNAPEIDRLLVDIWPEYDRPEVLVIYHLTLSTDTSLPAQLTLHIPSEARRPYNVAMRDVDGMLYNLDYSTFVEGEWLAVTLTTPSPEVQLEYYDSSLTRTGDDRTYEFHWLSNYTVGEMSVRIQQPVNVTKIELPPDMGKGRQEQDGLIYYTGVFGRVNADTLFTITLKYRKNGDALSAAQQPVKAAQPLEGPIAGRTSYAQVLPWMLGALGIVLIAGGIYWYRQAGRLPRTAPPKRHSPRTQKAPSGQAAITVYCHQCGKRAMPGDLFCRTCGTKLRNE